MNRTNLYKYICDEIKHEKTISREQLIAENEKFLECDEKSATDYDISNCAISLEKADDDFLKVQESPLVMETFDFSDIITKIRAINHFKALLDLDFCEEPRKFVGDILFSLTEILLLPSPKEIM